MSEHQNDKERHIGPFRWRGEWNWKDITERGMSAVLTGTIIGTVIYVLGRLFGA